MRALKITSSITRRDEKSMEKYLTEISRYDVLTPDEEYKLFSKIRSGDEEALLRIVNHNLRFVVSVAKQYQHLGLWLGDLINEGNIGLIKAASRFDETRGFKFISYAVWWIRQCIIQSINQKARKIRLPLNQKAATSKVMKQIIIFMQQEGREPSEEELADATGFTVAVVKKSLKNYKLCQSLDAPVGDESDASLASLLEDGNVLQPDHDVAVKESQKIEVQQLLSKLSPRQATVVAMYYGINRKYPVSLTDISAHIGVSRERVRQIKDRGLEKLRLHAGNFAPTFSMN